MSNVSLPQGQMSSEQYPREMPPTGGQPQRTNPLILGAILLAVGALLLVQNLGILRGVAEFIWPILFAAGGLLFLWVYAGSPHDRWWALIPGFALFGLSGTIVLGEFAPSDLEFLAGAAILGGVGLGFAAVYFTRREFWWAIIPAGVLITLSAVVVAADGPMRDLLRPEFVLFLGFGLTFLLVALSSTDEGNSRWWAYIPAGVMFLIGFIVFAQGPEGLAIMSWLWPVILILVGAILLLRGLAGKRL